MRQIIILILIIIVVIISALWFYQDDQKTQANTIKAEKVLVNDGFDKFYQKEDNQFCVKDRTEQESIVKDMMWALGNDEYRAVREIECEGGFKGLLIK